MLFWVSVPANEERHNQPGLNAGSALTDGPHPPCSSPGNSSPVAAVQIQMQAHCQPPNPPVLSLHTTVAVPIVSAALRWRTW